MGWVPPNPHAIPGGSPLIIIPNTLKAAAPEGTITVTDQKSELKIFSNGTATLNGNVKDIANVLGKVVLNNYSKSSHLKLNECIMIVCTSGFAYTIDWIGKGVLQDDLMPEPLFWEEFKMEFERYCKMKAFL